MYKRQTYFRLVEVPASYEEGLRNIEIGTADIVMEIPRHLERDWMNGEDTLSLIHIFYCLYRE